VWLCEQCTIDMGRQEVMEEVYENEGYASGVNNSSHGVWCAFRVMQAFEGKVEI
jgi:hypothetical protein